MADLRADEPRVPGAPSLVRGFLGRNVLLLSLTSLFTDVGSEMVYPLLPLFLVGALGASPAALGIIEGIAESTASLLRVYSGHVSDRLSQRKPVTLVGYSASAVGKVLLAAATSWGWVFGARVVDRLGKGIRSAPRDALLAESVPKEALGRAFGFHRAMDTLGAAVGVALAYFLYISSHDGLRTVFLWSILPAVLGVLALAFIRERPPLGPRTVRPALRPIAAWRTVPTRLRLFLIVTFLFTLGNSSNQFLLLRAHGLGLDNGQVILLYLVYNVVHALASYPAGRLSDAVGRKHLLVAGYAFYGLTYLGFALATGPVAAWGLFVIYGLYIGITDGVEKALIAELSPADLKGTMLGLHGTIVAAGLLPASWLAGVLWQSVDPAAPFYFGGAMGLLAAVLLARLL